MKRREFISPRGGRVAARGASAAGGALQASADEVIE